MDTLYFVGLSVGVLAALLLVVFGAERVLRGPIKLAEAHKNAAVALTEAGLLLGTCFVAASAVGGALVGDSFAGDLLWSAVYGFSGAFLLVASGRLGVLLLLRSRLPAEIARGNVAAGLAAGAHYAATGLIVASCFAGRDFSSLVLALVFFVLGQTTLYLMVSLFRALTPYDDGEEILGENLAAALSYAGVTLALGLVIAAAAEGGFLGWVESLRSYALSLLFALILYPVRQVLVQWAILGGGFSLRRGRLDHCIAVERSAGVAALEASAYVAAAYVMVSIA